MNILVTDIEQIRPGMALDLFFGQRNVNNEVVWVRAIVDDEVFVIRRWSERKGWMYACVHKGLYEGFIGYADFKITIIEVED